MFVYGILKALRLGYISGKKYEETALSGYNLMVDTFVVSSKSDNILNLDWTVQTGSLSSNGTYDVCTSYIYSVHKSLRSRLIFVWLQYYISIPLFQNDLKGVASFLFAAYEYEIKKF